MVKTYHVTVQISPITFFSFCRAGAILWTVSYGGANTDNINLMKYIRVILF